jgi:hypothetical protein
MKTSSWFIYRGPGRVGISRGTPRGIGAGFRHFRPLNPTREMLSLPDDEFDCQYAELLSRLDPSDTWAALHELAGGAEPVLLCFERPPFSDANRCHRRQVAAWLERRLGVDVPEYDPNAKAG